MENKFIVFTLFVLLLALHVSADAQQTKKIPRIGYLGIGAPSASPARIEAFRQGLRDLGYVEGKNIFIEHRYAEGKLDRLQALAVELVRLNVDLIVSAGPTVTRAVKQATVTIPIIMAYDDDPVSNGFVASLARPGGNITGLSTLAPGISGKQLELLKEIVPKLSHVAVLGDAAQPGNPQAFAEINLAADGLGVRRQILDIQDPKDIEPAFRAAKKGHANALLMLASPVLLSQRRRVADLAVKSRLPAIYGRPEFVEDGGLLYYGTSFNELFRRAADFVDKILKGAKPADLPVEQPKKFEFVINLKSAKQIGLTIPPNVLARADRVIK